MFTCVLNELEFHEPAFVEFAQFPIYNGRMADEWNEGLRCPKCRKTGKASLSQGDGDGVPTARSVPDGFKIINTEHGPTFRCGDCDVEVDP
jgi:hypothetical protein